MLRKSEDFEISDVVENEANHKMGVVVGFIDLPEPLFAGTEDEETRALLVQKKGGSRGYFLPGLCRKVI